MMTRKSYGQFCGVARALDKVGERWTLLMVRELLIEDRTFGQLQESLVGIGPSLLAKRLSDCCEDGLIERNSAPRRSKSVTYRLTEVGRSLERVIIELIRWGGVWMHSGPGGDLIDPRWAPLVLKAMLEGQSWRRGRVHIDVEGVLITISGSSGTLRVNSGHHGNAVTLIETSFPTLLAIASGAQSLEDSDALVSGDAVVGHEVFGGAIDSTPRLQI